ncbi:MAG: 2-dehydro-3-deoxygalactonokinase [Novosphingobium sp.]
MKDWSDGFVAIDWGTTNRRAYLLDAAGVVVAEMEDDLGVTSVPAGGFERAVATIAERFGDKPMLLAGMIGSNRGWREAPYVRCPAGPAQLARQLLWIEEGRIAIVPGLSIVSGRHADVMRGEEVQVFGLSRLGRGGGDATICHPGTHTKWVKLQAGQVVDFRTVMTGELFSLLCEHSILAPTLQGTVDPGEPFLAGVDATWSGEALTAELFAIRARVLLSLMDAQDAASYASGLLIGCDLRAGLAAGEGKEIFIVGRPSLNRLYAAALERCGFTAREVDGAEAFVAGMQHIKESFA